MHLIGVPIRASEFGEHRAVGETDQDIFDLAWWKIVTGGQAL